MLNSYLKISKLLSILINKIIVNIILKINILDVFDNKINE